VIEPANFADLDELEQPLLAFEARYNGTASPANWRYTNAVPHIVMTAALGHPRHQRERRLGALQRVDPSTSRPGH